MNFFQMVTHILFLVTIVAMVIPIGSFAETVVQEHNSLLNVTIDTKPVENPSQIDFFYDDDCESCMRVKPYIDSLKTSYPEIVFTYHNICSEVSDGKKNLEIFDEYKKERSIESGYVPMVFYGDTVIQGDKNISRDLQSSIQTNLGLGLNSPRVSLPTPTPEVSYLSIDSDAVEFFFDEHSEPCMTVLPYIDSLKTAYPEIVFTYHNVCGKTPENKPNTTLLDSFIRERGLTDPNIPLVTFGDTVIQGDVNISRDLQSLVQTKLGLDKTPPRVPVPVSSPETSSLPIDSGAVEFYFDEHCEPCMTALPYIDSLRSAYPGIVFNYHNICGKNPENIQNRSLFNNLQRQSGLSNVSVPVVSIGNTIILGDNIQTELEPILQASTATMKSSTTPSALDQIIHMITSLFSQ